MVLFDTGVTVILVLVHKLIPCNFLYISKIKGKENQ